MLLLNYDPFFLAKENIWRQRSPWWLSFLDDDLLGQLQIHFEELLVLLLEYLALIIELEGGYGLIFDIQGLFLIIIWFRFILYIRIFSCFLSIRITHLLVILYRWQQNLLAAIFATSPHATLGKFSYLVVVLLNSWYASSFGCFFSRFILLFTLLHSLYFGFGLCKVIRYSRWVLIIVIHILVLINYKKFRILIQ